MLETGFHVLLYYFKFILTSIGNVMLYFYPQFFAFVIP